MYSKKVESNTWFTWRKKIERVTRTGNSWRGSNHLRRSERG
jgi:hypothetical protein